MTIQIRTLREHSHNRRGARLGRVAIAALVAAVLGFAGNVFASGFAYPENRFMRTVVVSPVPGDPGASGDQLLAAVNSISPSPSDPWLVKVEPGVFDLGTESLVLVPGLEIEGSGEDVTIIQGLAQALDANFDRGKGVVNGADQATLRDLTVRCVTDSGAGLGGCISIANVHAAPSLSGITIESQGFGNHWGIRNTYSSPLVEEVTIRLDGGTDNYGIVNAGDSFPTILRSTITASDGSNLNAGVFDREGGGPTMIEDSEIVALGGQEAVGVYEYTPSPLDMTIDDSFIQAAGAASNTGILADLHRFEIQGAVITGDVAIDILGQVSVTSSELMATGSTIVQADKVRLGGTRLSPGGAVFGSSEAVCAAVYVLSNPVQFFATDCPTGSSKRQRGAHGLHTARNLAGGELK
jgi:hypothetical protein